MNVADPLEQGNLGNLGTIRIELLQVEFVESRAPTYYVPGLANTPDGKGSRVPGARGVLYVFLLGQSSFTKGLTCVI